MKTQKPKPLSWKPVRRGAIYCAPACGHGCTHAEFKAATAKAKTLCALLSQQSVKGWKPRVWENLGWHYAAISPCGRIKVHPLDAGWSGYTAFIGYPESPGGTWTGQAPTPLNAVKKAAAAAKDFLSQIQATIHNLPV